MANTGFALHLIEPLGLDYHDLSRVPRKVMETVPPSERLKIPMQPNNRSLNLSNSVAIVAYEAWRQMAFAGAQ